MILEVIEAKGFIEVKDVSYAEGVSSLTPSATKELTS